MVEHSALAGEIRTLLSLRGCSPALAWVTDADGCNALSNYLGNQLLDVPATFVSQDDPGAIENDILTAKSAGISGFWLSWNGDGTLSQTRTTVTYTRRLSE